MNNIDKIPVKFEKSDRVQGKYLVVKNRLIYCADITILPNGYNVLIFMDLASKLIVAHQAMKKAFTSQDVINLILISIIRRRDDQEYTIFHTDNASIFKSKEIQEFALSHNIILSQGEPGVHHNQIIERFNGTFKTYLRATLLKALKNEQNLKSINKTSLGKLLKQAPKTHQIESLITETIEFYNNKGHRGERMFGLAPAQMDQALDYHQNLIPEKAPILAPNDNSPEAIEIAAIRAKVIDKYAGNWIYFFVDWKHENDYAIQKLSLQNSALIDQTRALIEQNQALKQDLVYLRKREEERENMEKETLAKKLKRQNATKLKIREAVEPKEFAQILEMAPSVYKDPITRARVVCALILLYSSGLRIANLRKITLRHMEELLLNGETTLPIIKKGDHRGMLFLGNRGKLFLSEFAFEIETISNILKLKSSDPLNAFFFSPRKDPENPISVRNLDEQVNRVLIKASVLLGKHLRSHSFRASFITDLLKQDVPIDNVKDLIGHRSIGTTALYKRNKMQLEQARAAIRNLTSARYKNFQIPMRKRKKAKLTKQVDVAHEPITEANFMSTKE